MSGVTYDTGALLAAEAGSQRMWKLHDGFLDQKRAVYVPAAVLAQAWRGGPQAKLSRLLNGCEVEALGEKEARKTGAACKAGQTADVVDASVVIGALSRGDIVITSDPGDLGRIADALGQRLTIQGV